MPSPTVGVPPPAFPPYHPDHTAGQNVSFTIVTMLCVAGAYEGTSHSQALATATVLAVATAAGMHARLAMGRLTAAVQIVACGLLLLLMGAAPRLVGGQILTGLVGAELVARCAARTALVRIGMWTGALAGLASAFGSMAAATQGVTESIREALAATAGGFFAAPLTLALGPLAERWFGHITRWTLSEWLSYEHPLLRELASTAPGTFQHSINVGILADSGAAAIGADALLARVGGLYHDVGKSRAAAYFTENQHETNPHDGLAPWDSARILRAHVADGVELVERHRMGPRIGAFVREHHGTSLMRLFRDKALALATPAANHNTYQYPGPRPRSRETAIVMIADQIEATARSATSTDDAACDQIVERTLVRLQEEDQLEDCGLSAQEISELRRGLSRALQAMYHRRLPYPSPVAPGARQVGVPFWTRLFGRPRSES